MTFSVNMLAGTQSDAIVPANTSKNTILTCPKGSSYVLVSIWALSASGTTTVTLHFEDNSKSSTEVDFLVLTATTTGATQDISGITLNENDVLKATASVADVDILLTYAVRGGGSGA